MSILSNLFGKYGDDIAKAATKTISNKADDAVRVMASYADDLARPISNKTDDIVRIGSKNVAPINPDTLPSGWDDLDKLLSGKSPVEQAIGKSRGKITKNDLIDYLTEYGYDTTGDKNQLWKTAEDAFYNNWADDMYSKDAGNVVEYIDKRRWNQDKLGGVQEPYIGAKGRVGRLDAELSDRLGIGRSNTPFNDTFRGGGLGNYSSDGTISAHPTWSVGEDGISTVGHERLHSFQNESKKWNYDDSVAQAYNQLHEDLAPFIHDEETVLKRFNEPGKIKYWSNPDEQEARMFQNYLDSKKFTNRGGVSSKLNEWGEEINPAFDKFLNTLRDLSKKGIALPAVTGVAGGGAILSSLLNNNQGKES